MGPDAGCREVWPAMSRYLDLLEESMTVAVKCERCHKERDPAEIKDIAGIGEFCEFCRNTIQAVIDVYGVDAAKGWTYHPRTDLVGFIEGKNKTVLDCGCWAGYTLELLREEGHTPYGLDIEDNRKVALDVPFFQCDLETCNHVNGAAYIGAPTFDYILFGDVLEHLVNPIPALMFAKQNLAPKGKIIISVPNMGWIGAVMQLLKGDPIRDETGHFDKTHLRFYTLPTLIATVEEAGFRPVAWAAKQLANTPPWDAGDHEILNWQFDDVIIPCSKSRYESLQMYQILLMADAG